MTKVLFVNSAEEVVELPLVENMYYYKAEDSVSWEVWIYYGEELRETIPIGMNEWDELEVEVVVEEWFYKCTEMENDEVF